ncbi:MAG: LPS export ABC transporter periplasmic protein LptC [Legionellaceae bacterium]|nr:LPS export ABC transporter periplasmic protein LptC [Legionellaceae bacterium]
MNKIKFTGWLVTLFAVMACSTWYYIDSFSNIKISFDGADLRKSIDATITDLSVKEFDANGVMINFLETPLIRHVPENNTHYLTKPHLIINQEDKAPWEINSLEAVAMRGGKEVKFSDDVVIVQKEYGNSEEVSVYTDEITYFPGEKYALTQKNVKLLQGGSFIMATGIKAYLDESRVQLLSNARAHYEKSHG